MEADCLSGSSPKKVIPEHEFSVAIKPESLTNLFEQNSVLCLVRLFGMQAQNDCYTAKCRH